MGNIAQFGIARASDVSLSLRAQTRGFNLLRSIQDSQRFTGSPAALLLTPEQASAIQPLMAIPPTKDGRSPEVFDQLYDQLYAFFIAGNYEELERHASNFLSKSPIVPNSVRPAYEQRIRQFFILKGLKSTDTERLALYDQLGEAARAEWLGQAHARIDLEKAQTLAVAVSGQAPPSDSHLLGGLQAGLAFAVLEASVRPLKASEDRRKFPNKLIDRVLGLAAYLPAFVFELEICKTRNGDPAKGGGALARRISRFQAFEERVKKITAKTDIVNASPDKPRPAAGTLGHTSDCDCKCDDAPCMPIDPCCGEVRWYVTELLTLKDKTHCYKPSDIAYIENVAPYETRIRTHGMKRTVTETSEDETNTNREEERDHQVTDRFNLQKEIQNNLKASLDVNAILKGPTGSGTYEVTTDASLSKDSAYREAREQARDEVEKATLKIQVQTRKLRTRTVTTESTEQNKHKFKNSTSSAAVAKYFWVTQEKRGQLFSHGPALTIDLLIPSPAMLFKELEKRKHEAGLPKPEPKKPAAPTLDGQALTPNAIRPDNYTTLVSTALVTDYDAPPTQPLTLYQAYTLTRASNVATVTIPPGYHATIIEMTSVTLHKGVTSVGGSARISAGFGGAWVHKLTDGADTVSANIDVVASSDIILGHDNASKDSSITVRITLTPFPVDLGPWQKSIYTLIMSKYLEALSKYEAALSDYNAAVAAYNQKMEDKIKGRHPFACEEIMRTELKRSAIFMMCGEFDWPGVMNMKAQPCGLPWPNRRQSDKATNEWYFFDRAFNWNQASFTFYDYFRNPMCKWVDTYEPDEPNFLFKAFLRAGYCRVTIPVSPGMEEDVRTYLQTGGLWGETGTWPTNPNDPRWISVIDEIKHNYDCYQQDREGYAEAYRNPGSVTFDSRMKVFTDRYWDPVPTPGTIDQDAINLDLDRQIFIDGIEYRIVSIAADPNSAPYSTIPGSMRSWIFGLERKFESQPFIDPAATTPLLKPYNFAIGAKYVGAPFHFELPTDLIWIGDQSNACLPCYPIECDCHAPVPIQTDGKPDKPNDDNADAEGE